MGRRKPIIQYPPAEQRERMAEFERWVKDARSAWRRGEAVVLLSFGEYLDLTAKKAVSPLDVEEFTMRIAHARDVADREKGSHQLLAVLAELQLEIAARLTRLTKERDR